MAYRVTNLTNGNTATANELRDGLTVALRPTSEENATIMADIEQMVSTDDKGKRLSELEGRLNVTVESIE